LLRYSLKDYYGGPNITKDFRVLLLKITVDFPKSLQLEFHQRMQNLLAQEENVAMNSF